MQIILAKGATKQQLRFNFTKGDFWAKDAEYEKYTENE